MTAERARDLERPVVAVVRELAAARLDEARRALARAGDERDSRGLHDFRVALRKLRSLLQAYGEGFERPVRRAALGRLRAIGEQTGAARDAEAQLEWLALNLRSPSRAVRAARDALVAALEAAQRVGYARVRGDTVTEFFALWAELRDACVGHRAGAVPLPDGESFARVSGRQLAQALQRLQSQLAHVHSLGDEEPAHEARIAAKRVRYVLEPLRDALPRAQEVVGRLKDLQDLLGELNDLRVLRTQVRGVLERAALQRVQIRMAAVQALSSAPPADRDDARSRAVPGAVLENGCIEVARRLETRRRQLFTTLSKCWLGAASQPFFALAQTLLQELLGMGESHVEIERKFLLKELPKLPQDAELVEIEQGYLGDGTTPERLRRARSGNQVRYFRTVKLGRGESRVELEQELSAEEFERLWPATEGCRVEKRRHRVPAAQGTWEIDEFTDRDLVLAELELPEAGLRVELPDWLAPSVLRDVTDDPAYGNLALARAGSTP